jgi:hypothetical protein
MRNFSNLLALDREPHVGRDILHVLPDKIILYFLLSTYQPR